MIPYLSCGVCVACRRGKTNCCQRIAVLGVHIDGGMADYVCVPEGNVAAADGVTLDQAAMVEFLAIGAHAVRRANPQTRRPRSRRRRRADRRRLHDLRASCAAAR